MRTTKQLLISMIALLCCTGVWALDRDTENYYILSSLQDWQDFASLAQTVPTINARMIADIDLGDDQTMIGSESVPYEGIFDGQGHKLTVAYSQAGITNGIGPFHAVGAATIQNLHVDGSMLTNCGIGGIAGIIVGNVTIQKCWVSASMESVGSNYTGTIGGFCSWCAAANCHLTIEDCLFDGGIVNNAYCGGFMSHVEQSSSSVTMRRGLNVATYPTTTNENGTFVREVLSGVRNLETSTLFHKKVFGSAQGTQVTDEQLADGSITTALQAGRSETVWVQDATSGQPRLDVFNHPVTTYDPYVHPTSQIINLSELTADYIAQDGDVLTGTTGYSVQIAADATITLSDVTITNCRKSPIQCLGNATINIEDGSVNRLRDSDEDSNSYGRPALAFGPSGTTLTINGNTGRLIAIGGRLSSAIGCRDNRVAYGGLIINGGVISAHGNSSYTSGIGAVGADDSHGSSCGDITINGGTINVAASDGIGIGAGSPNSCGAITINGGTITSHAVRSIAIGGNCSKVVINGGDINASTTSSVGIGSSGVVYIEGGTIVASASDWEGVGISGDKGVLIRSSITSLTASKGPYGANAIQGRPVYISENLNDVTEGNSRTLTPKASFDPEADIEQDGEGYYLIGSLQNWKEFAVLAQIEASPKGKLVADINLGDEQAIIGSFEGGIFDGQGHTITINLSTTTPYVGLFCDIIDATIKNLHVTGSINTTKRYVGGMVGRVYSGTSTIQNCWSSVNVTTTYSGYGFQGGMIGCVNGTLNISDCLYDGALNGSSADTWGGFVGWLYDTTNISNCLFASDEINVRFSDTATLVAGGGNITNCYYKNVMGTAQGTQATAAELADGTTATALQADRAEEVWVQDPVTNQPMLALFASGPGTFSVGNFKYTVTDEEHHYVSIAKADEAELSGALEIPSSVTYKTVKYTVTSIANSGFYWNEDITEVTIPNTVTSIGESAFSGCSKLTTITLPSTLTTIGDYAFNDCSSLASFSVPGSVTTIGSMVFDYCSIPTFTFEASNTAITCSATIPCTNHLYLNRDIVKDGALTYGNVKALTIGANVTTIYNNMFNGSHYLNSIDFSEATGLTSIGDYAFYDCGNYVPTDPEEDPVPNLTTIDLSNTKVTSIGENAFVSCSKLTTITLPNTLQTIGNSAFYGCSSLTSFSVPGSVTTIGSMVFDICSIPTFTFEASNTAITCSATIPCSDHLYLNRDINTEGYELTTRAIKALTIGANVTTIYNNMFNGSQYLNSIDFSEATGLTSIGDYAFIGCGNYVPTDPEEDPVPNLTTIDLSNTKVTSIGQYAFNNCNRLTGISLPNTLQTINDGAFNGCSSLASFSVPGSVTTIGSVAFDFCNNLADFTFEASNTAITCSATIPCTNLYLGRDITFTENGFSGVSALTIGTNVTSIGSLFFYNDITSVTVPWDSPITIADDAFSDDTYANATLWVPGGTMDAYETADNWKKFAHKDFSSFVVSITGSAHGTLAVGEISSTNNETATTLIDRGEDAVFTVTPATGYEASTFTVNGEAAALTDNSYTVENLSADQTVVAGFTPITYTLTYTLNGGTATNPATYTIETETFTLNNPTKAGYDFAGWKLNGEGDAMTTVTISQGSTGNLAYTATWTPITYNIVYTLDGGTATNPATYTIETETFTLNNPTKTGHTFKGWKLNGEGDALMEVTIAQGSTGDKAYTATWQVNQYTITFDSNGGSAVDPITQDYGTTVTAPDDPTKPGCDFAGWTPELPETMPAENMTVTATWTELTYTVSITGDGVSADNMNPKYGDDVVITIAEDEDRTLNTLTVNVEDVTAYVVDGQYTIHNVTGNVVVVATFNATKEFITLAQGVGTFSCAQDLNFTGSELKAYIAAGYNKEESQVLLVRVYDIPAGTGLYLKGEADVTYKIPYSTSQAYYVNMLKANLTASSIAKTSGDKSNFLLNKVDGEYGFFAPSETATLGAQKAYLQVPTSFMSGPEEARAISIAFEDDETTNISDFELFTNSNEHLYNLNGQRVEKAGRGIYIKNGKKFVIK